VERALRVFESQLRWLVRQEWHRANSFDEVCELLDEDGFELDERCRIRWRRPPALEATLAGLTDPSGIRAELERIRRALPDDPAGTIGAAKQLVEATAKVVLTERHLLVTTDARVPELVKAAQQALHLHPSSTIPGPDSSELESAPSIQRPSMGLLRRPTPGEMVEGGRLSRPCRPGAQSRAIEKTRLRLRRHSHFQQRRLTPTDPLQSRTRQ
jgi:hypothetical protein